MCCPNACKDEVRLHNFRLDHQLPGDFVRPQFGPVFLYPLWTIFWVLFHVSWMLADVYWSVWDERSNDQYAIKLTNWTIVLLLVYSFVDCGSTCYVHLKKTTEFYDATMEMPWYLKVNWILFNVVNTSSFIVTITYYILLDYSSHVGSIYKHGINSACVILNILFSAKPVRVYHLVHPMIYSLLYMVSTIVYQFATGISVYPVLDWYHPGKTLALSLSLIFIAMPITHLIVFALYKVRSKMYKTYCGTNKVKGIFRNTESTQCVIISDQISGLERSDNE